MVDEIEVGAERNVQRLLLAGEREMRSADYSTSASTVEMDLMRQVLNDDPGCKCVSLNNIVHGSTLQIRCESHLFVLRVHTRGATCLYYEKKN